MADEADAGGGGGDASIEECPKCEICVPGLPGWMATFSDLVTLLLTFFVLLLSFAKTESAKYEAALGSIRNAFGGNVLKHGEVIQRGKSPDDSPTMLESQQPIKPFPIDFLTMEGILDKHEINRESDESLKEVKNDLNDFQLSDNVTVYEMAEGIKVMVKDKIFFKKGSVVPSSVNIEVYDRLVKMLSEKNWTLYILGHASRGETSNNGSRDAFDLSASRASAVARNLMKQGVRAEQVTTTFYGDTRPDKVLKKNGEERQELNRRVEFIIRKRDVATPGHEVEPK
ncbi:MAG: OmpA family protein [Halobacteriovoraceae bacterium]|nr:OmpA family protein [Halobacteriovoraceae bacterium]